MTTSPVSAAPNDPAVLPPQGPTDRRLLGLDRRALVPAIVVAVFAAIAFWGLPALDKAVTVEDPVRAGDVVQVGDSAAFTPPVGWDLRTGVRRGDAPVTGFPGTAQLTGSGVILTVIADSFAGTPRALLAQIERTNERLDADHSITITGQARPLTAASGKRGVISRFTASSGGGLVAAFTFAGTGVELVAFAPTTWDGSTREAILKTFRSVAQVRALGNEGS